MFIHLHNHSHYSILEWLPKPADYVAKAKELWMTAVAITDTWNIHGCFELYKEAKKAWIKPILWTEILVESSLDQNINHKLVLLAKSNKWYQNILSLVSKANLDNPSKTSKLLFEDLIEFKKEVKDLELVCLSWPVSWEIPYYILAGKSDEEISKRINEYINLFWKENYYLELLYHDDIPKQNFITDKLIEISNKFDIAVVAANNCYYINKEDKQTQDVIVAMGTWHELENPDRPTMINWDYSFLTEEEMQQLFGFIPEALENSVKIADMVDIKIKTWGILIPKYELPEEDQKIYDEARKLELDNKEIKQISRDEWYLRYLSYIWLNKRYNTWLEKETIFKLVQKLDKVGLEKKLTETSPQELKELSITFYSDEKKKLINEFSKDTQEKIERLEYELAVVHEMWFDAYFLIVSDYIIWAKNNDIPVWPWRWSAAWSLMAFLTEITDIDPLPYQLLFERFLNPARISMPDIDTDFADTERDKVVDYCRKKYWEDKVVQICTFGTFAARAAVKDVWRTFWIPFSEMNDLAKLIPEKPWTKLKQALEESLEFKKAYDENKKYKEIVDIALKIEWNVRQLWVHACAVIIAPEPMTNFTALQYPPKDSNTIVTQYSANPLEDLGLLKMDFLGLRNLTIIKRAQRIIKNTKWVDINILDIDLKDKKVFDEVFVPWDTTWIFQFESDWMRKYLKDLAPDSFEDLIAMVSLYRPWPIAYIPTYIDVKFWRKEKKYLTDELYEILKKAWYSEEEIIEEWKKLDEDLSSILDITYWIAVYQEQLLFIVQYMAWFSLWEADLLRRWVWKKILDVVEELRKEFIEKWEKFRQYKPETTDYIYREMIMPAANYSFNKSHAACYALIAYQTAYLKTYYKTEFMTSLMVSDEENMDRVVLEVWECQNYWISVLPPSVNESLKHFTYISDKSIRFGLKAIKWIWDGPIDKIIEARLEAGGKFLNLEQFIEFCWKEVINKKSLEALIKSWAMDELWIRKQMFDSIEEMIKFCRRDERKKETNQIWLFDNSEDFEEKLELNDSEEFSFEEKLIWEKEMIGFSVSGHALDWLKRYCHRRSQNISKLKKSFEELEKMEDKKNDRSKAIWVVNDMRKIFTKTWKQIVFLKCEGFDYDFEVVIFEKNLEQVKDKLDIDKIIIVEGFLDINLEYKRKSIKAQDISIATISQVREQAKDMWIFDDSKRYVNINLNQSAEDEDNEEKNNCNNTCEVLPSNFEDELENKIEKNKAELEDKIKQDKFTVVIPNNALKKDLLDLKEFLSTEDKWSIQIMLDLRWQEIDTKVSLKNCNNLEIWIKNKWN